MTPRIRLIAPLLVSWALALPLAAGTTGEKPLLESDDAAPAVVPLDLNWEMVQHNGTRTKLQLGPKIFIPDGETKNAGGKPSGVELSPALTMVGEEIHEAELPEEVRQKPVFLDFSLSGTVGSSPDNGTVINIDGAVIGFQQRPGIDRADVMVMDVGSDGSLVWRKAGWGLPIDALSQITASPRIAVQLDHKNRKWGLYCTDLLLVGGLPLLAEKGKPTITLIAGAKDTDVAILKRIEMSDKPMRRQKAVLPTGAEGRVVVRKAIDPKPGVPTTVYHLEVPLNPQRVEKDAGRESK